MVYVVVDDGVTFTLVPLSDPGIQLYVDAPLAVSVVEPPVQMDALFALAPTTGDVFTFMVRVAVEVHPFAAVPVTVYVVVAAGVTDTGEPDNAPGIQLYVEAPVAESVTVLPEQMVVVEEDALTTGDGFTLITCVAVPLQPLLVPVTVYVVIAVGETLTVAPVSEPGIHVYVVAPVAVMATELPLQMVVVGEDTLTVGVGLTVIVRVAVLVQPFAAVPVTV
jgi:hypothetical protein